MWNVFRTGVDFTDRKIAELALEESERNYKELANAGDTLIVIINKQLECTYLNHQAIHFLGQTETSLINKHIRTFIHQEDLLENLQQKDNIKLFKNFITENRVKRFDGE